MSRLGRRPALALLAGLSIGSRASMAGGPGTEVAEWRAFATRFLQPDGRVIDTFNGGVSHTEGQGWALLCAERADDRAAFDLVLGWTRRMLSRRDDALFAWRYRPEQGVEDQNNASDGDLMIAWALLRAAERWGEAEHAALGTAVARDVLRLLVRQVGEETVLLPGLRGFEQREHIIVNPPYYAFPAIRALAKAVPDPRWLRLAADGIGLLRRARFGRWGLPSDWVALPRHGGRPVPAPGWPARFSYDAVRVPLYLAWAGLGREPAARAAADFWADPRHPRLPAWTDLGTDALSPYQASSGVQAIARLAGGQQAEPPVLPRLPSVSEARDYYSAILTLLVRLAWRDSAPVQT
jgi:endoglucanase